MATVYQRKRAGKYIANFKDERGLWKDRSTGTSDKRAAQEIATQWETAAAKKRAGLADPRDEAYRDAERKPLLAVVDDAGPVKEPGHVDDFERMLLAQGRAKGSVETKAHRIREIVKAAGFKRLSQIQRAKVVETVDGMQGKAARTRAHYLSAMKQFCRWLWTEGRMRDHVLAGVKIPVVVSKDEREYVRRAISKGEFEALIRAAKGGPVVKGLEGETRSFMYKIAAWTGFRAGEVRSLTPASFSLEQTEPVVTVAAGYSKRGKRSGKDDVQPLPAAAVAELKTWLKGKPAARLFPITKWRVAGMLRSDLAAARAAWVNEAGENVEVRQQRQESDFLAHENASGHVLDFHSLRAGYCTWLAESGVSIKTLQTLARHSTPALTLAVYVAAPSLADASAALDALPVPTGTPAATPEPMRMTGTDAVAELPAAVGSVGVDGRAGNMQETAHVSGHFGAFACATSQSTHVDMSGDKTPVNIGETASIHTEAEGFEPPVDLRRRRFSKPVRENRKALSGNGLQKEGAASAGNMRETAQENRGKAGPGTAQQTTLRLTPDPLADVRLAALVDAWPDLPEPVRAGIAAMVKAAGGGA